MSPDRASIKERVVAVAGNLGRASGLERAPRLTGWCETPRRKRQADSRATSGARVVKARGRRGGEIRPSHAEGKALGRRKPRRGSADDRR